jgi:predicted aldo/keto reductase-like oxidoreductase
MDRNEVLEANLKNAESFEPLTEAGMDDVKKLQEAFDELKSIYCTGCGYCMPCEQGVKIPDIFYALICYKVLGVPDYARFRYNFVLRKHKADLCAECGECEEKCPQEIEIMEQLKEAHRLLGGG